MADLPPLAPQTAAAVDQIWAARPPHMYDGRLFYYQRHARVGEGWAVWGAYGDYRLYYAQKRGGLALGLQSVGVSGLVVCRGHVIVARRGPSMTAYPGMLELVPSGGIDDGAAQPHSPVIDVEGQIRREFEEEVGLSAALIQAIQPFALIYDAQDSVYDVACEIRLDMPVGDVLASLATSPEYDAPLAVPIASLSDWLTTHVADLIPTSRALLAAWG